MVTKIKKWGNSQGLRFSKELLEEAKINVGDEVNVTIEKGSIVIKLVRKVRGKYKLKDLVSKIPKDYEPKEVDWGKPQGKEVW